MESTLTTAWSLLDDLAAAATDAGLRVATAHLTHGNVNVPDPYVMFEAYFEGFRSELRLTWYSCLRLDTLTGEDARSELEAFRAFIAERTPVAIQLSEERVEKYNSSISKLINHIKK